MPAQTNTIYFSDIFGISPQVLEEYGAFNISLINDLPLFVDPFLLFNSSDPEHQELHAAMIAYLRFLKQKAVAGTLDDGSLKNWFTFREIKENWLGYSKEGNRGSGLGMDFARALSRNLATVFSNFGSETVTRSTHLEKLCLIRAGVGRDNISDFTTNLIKGHLLQYTQEFARGHLRPDQRATVAVAKSRFNYQTETWETHRYDLPFVDGAHVILTPIDLLTKDEIWINKGDMCRDYPSIIESLPNHQLRAQLNNYFAKRLAEIQERDDRARERTRPRKRRGRPSRPPEPTARQHAEAIAATIQNHPAFIDYYIRYKEDHGEEAEDLADQRVRSSERLYIQQVRELTFALQQSTGFYKYAGTTHDEARRRVAYLKDVIENKGGWRVFYVDGEPLRREADLHIMFRLTWCNTPSDVSTEVNDGRGPADFKVSRGRFDKSIVEFKLAKSSSLARNLKRQAEAYKKASDAQHALKVIVYFTRDEEKKVRAILQVLKLENHRDVILIDARGDNKASASRL